MVLAAHLFISQIGFGMFYVIWQPFILSTGLEVVDLGIIQSALNLSTAVGLVVWGTLSDRLGRKPVLLLSHVFRMISIVLLTISGNYLFLVLFSFLMGFSSLFMQANPARSALISESVESSRRATAFSVLMAIQQLLSTLTASIGGYLAIESGYTSIFYICIIGELVGLILLTKFMRETRSSTQENGAEPFELKKFLSPEKGIIALYVILIVFSFGFNAGLSLLYGILVDKYGLTTFQLGLMSTVFNMTWALASVPVGKISDRYGRKPLLVIANFFAVAQLTIYLFSSSFQAFLLAEFFSAVEHAIWIPIWTTYVYEKLPAERLSTEMGKINAYSRIFSIPAPWFGGIIYSLLGFKAPLIFNISLILVVMVLLLTTDKK